MMYNEFVEGTGCKDNAHNYEVFRNLEVMYMNTDMTKAQIYEYGKKLVDNSKSEEEIMLERKIKAEIEELKEEVKYWTEQMESKKFFLSIETDEEWIRVWKEDIKNYKKHIAHTKAQIAALKWVLE